MNQTTMISKKLLLDKDIHFTPWLEKIDGRKKIPILKTIYKSGFFLIVSLLNCFLPIILCVISSFINPYGAQVVTGVGYVNAFLLTFCQLGVSFATSTYFLIKKFHNKKLVNEDSVISHSIIISVLMGLFIVIVYAISSYLYLWFSCNRPNTIQTINYGMMFLTTSMVFALLTCLNFLLVLYIKIKNNFLALFLQLFSTALSIGLSAIFTLATNLGPWGVGLGLSIGSLISLLVFIVVILIYCPFKFKMTYINFSYFTFKEIVTESVGGIAVSFFKGFGILLLAMSLPNKLGAFVPLSFQVARLIWFNLMYSVVWFAIGISDTIKYFYLMTDSTKFKPRLVINWFNKLLLINFLVTLLFCVGEWFLVDPLAQVYIQNGQYAPWLPKPSMPIGLQDELTNIFYNFKNILINHHVIDINFNGNILTATLSKISSWYDEGLSGRLKIIALISDLSKVSISPNIISDFLTYIKNYHGYTSYNSEIITGLVNHNFKEHDLLVKLGLDNFNANSSFYIFGYALLCSQWTVILPANKFITKKGINNWLLALVYAAAIGFVIGFGSYFSLVNTSNNFIRFLDAWTFPLLLLAVAIYIFVLIKWTITCIKYYKKDSI